ncbi:HAD family hydrolase [Nonomuraea typhae]|uniref:HAD family hydrolase n=1 Tax=Nonomuraea typhae TaxID=2603600 RepID=UPI0012FB9975|nr:HAD family phosphatase [Nonomuraea typhae]
MDALLFDLFGVIAPGQTPEDRAAIEAAAGARGSVFWNAYWDARGGYDLGELTGAEYWHAVGERLGRTFADVDALVALDVASWRRVDTDVLGYIRTLAGRGLRMGLLSNIPADLAGYFATHHGEVFDLFDVLGLSCRIGHAKPSPEAYLWCLEEFGLPAERVMFVDARPANVAGALAEGMQGHHYTSLPTLRAHLLARTYRTATGLTTPSRL